MVDLLAFLPAWPPGAALIALGLICAMARGQWVGALGLTGVALEFARLDVEGLALTGAVSVLVVVGLAALASSRVYALSESAVSPGLSLVLAGLLLMAVQLDHLGWVAVLLFLAGLLERALVPGGDVAGRDPATGAPTARAHAWRGAVLISLASASLMGLGAQGRMQDGGELLVEWIGTPFAGDAPSTLIFLGLVIPLALPPNWGGAGQAIAAGPGRRDAGSFVNAGLLRGLVLLVLLGRTFSGSDALLDVGLAVVVLAPVLALTGRQVTARFLALSIYGVLGLLMGVASIASDSAQGALGLSVFGLALAGSGASLALVLTTHARGREPGLGERGLGHVFPSAFGFALLCMLALIALPGTLLFEGRSSGLEAMSSDGAAAEALVFAMMAGPLAVFAALPFLRQAFFSPGLEGGHVEGRRATAPLAMIVALAIAAGSLIALGLVPSALGALLPSGGVAPSDRLLTGPQQLQVLLGAALFARIVRREKSTGPASGR